MVASSITGVLEGEQIQLTANGIKETTLHLDKCLAAQLDSEYNTVNSA